MTWLKLLQNIIRKLSNFPWDSGLRHRRDKKKKSTEESHSIAFNVVQIEIKETNVQHLSYLFFLRNGLWNEVQIKGGRKKDKKGWPCLKNVLLFAIEKSSILHLFLMAFDKWSKKIKAAQTTTAFIITYSRLGFWKGWAQEFNWKFSDFML